MRSDGGSRSLLSLGDGGHVTRLGREATASSIRYQVKPPYYFCRNPMDPYQICIKRQLSNIFQGLFSKTGILRFVPGFSRPLPLRHRGWPFPVASPDNPRSLPFFVLRALPRWLNRPRISLFMCVCYNQFAEGVLRVHRFVPYGLP